MAPKRLLIIEDDPDVAEMIGVFFSTRGFEIFTAVDGEEGIATARAKFPNLILLDVMLPDMDGFDVCKRLRTTTLTRHIPIMFLTQRDRRADKVNGLELGADDYITKPFDMEELRLRIETALIRSTRETLYDPRSGLPTRTMVMEALESSRGIHRVDVRLVHLQSFREVYGFMPVDEVLHFLGLLMAETLAVHGTPADFAGSLHDEHHVILSQTDNVAAMTRYLQDRFAREIKPFYSFTDADRGSMVTPDGNAFPLMTLAVTARHIPAIKRKTQTHATV